MSNLSADQSFARALGCGLLATALLFAAIVFGLAGKDFIAGWLAIGMWVALFASMWFSFGARR